MFSLFKRKSERLAEEVENTSQTVTKEQSSGVFRKFGEGFLNSLRSVFSQTGNWEETLEELEATLIQADVGLPTTQALIEALSLKVKEGASQDAESLIKILKTTMEEELLRPVRPLNISPNSLTVVMMVGINGVGKTTSTAKLGHMFSGYKRKVAFAACDTFRAGAVQQLQVWGERLKVPVVVGKENQDPASVAFDAIKFAREEGRDFLLVDTAGRLHTQKNLMEELRKVHRVLGNSFEGAPHECLLVLDATTGQNALQQARIFHEALGLTGLVLTKLDGTARGGIILAIQRELALPVRFVGLGEQPTDMQPFDAKSYCDGLFGE